MSRGATNTGSSNFQWASIGPIGMLTVVFTGIWLAVYTTAQANGVGTGGIGSAASGELVFLMLGLPIFFATFHKSLPDYGKYLIALAMGFVGVALLAVDQIGFAISCGSNLICLPVSNALGVSSLATSGGLLYQSSNLAKVVTLGAFSVCEVAGMQGFLRGILDAVLNIRSLVAGAILSTVVYGPFFALFHTFVTVAAYSQLLNVQPLYGTFNLAVLLTPFGLSAMVAQGILDTLVRATEYYEAALIAHPVFDMWITAHAVGLLSIAGVATVGVLSMGTTVIGIAAIRQRPITTVFRASRGPIGAGHFLAAVFVASIMLGLLGWLVVFSGLSFVSPVFFVAVFVIAVIFYGLFRLLGWILK